MATVVATELILCLRSKINFHIQEMYKFIEYPQNGVLLLLLYHGRMGGPPGIHQW